MYKNLSEIAAHMKRLRSKVIVPKKHCPLVRYCVLIDTVFFRRALAANVRQKNTFSHM